MTTSRRPLAELRSQRWFAADTIRAFAHRQRMQQTGLRRDDFLGKPVIAIVNTWSDLSTCHAHLRERAEAVKRGVWQAGGFPVELPALSLGEVDRQADDDALPQPARAGDRGAAALAPGRRRRAAGRLRQDHARPADGRDQHGPAGDLLPRGTDVDGLLARGEDRRRHAHQEVLGRAAAGTHHAGRLDRARGPDDPHGAAPATRWAPRRR